MGTFRLYPSKSNTIIENSPTINTGQNEVGELWYGEDGVTRHLFKFDDTYYNSYYALGFLPAITATTPEFKLKLINPIELDSDQILAESFDIEVYAVTRDWDEGSGWDFENGTAGFSCWNSATTIQAWTTPGGDYGDLIFSGHVDVPDVDNEFLSLTYSYN